MTITVDIHGAADLLKVHYKTVLDMIGDGELPAAKVGKAYVLMTKDVSDYVEAQIVKQTAERMRRAIKPAPKPTTRLLQGRTLLNLRSA